MSDQIERNGNVGKFARTQVLTSGDYFFTGSDSDGATGSVAAQTYGASGILLNNTAAGGVTMSGGGEIPLSAFTDGVVHEVSPRKINVTAGVVYVLFGRGGRS